MSQAAIIDGLSGQWVVGAPLPTGGQVVPYQTGAGGGYALPAPSRYQVPVGGATSRLDEAFNAETYTTPTGARAWRPTVAENELIDTVTRNPYHGLDELVESGRAIGGPGVGGRALRAAPYVGDVIGGAVEAGIVYGETGSLTHATFAGGGALAGSIAGTAIGGAVGAVGGPVGVAVGGFLGGAVGGALGSALGQGLANLIDPLPPSNRNGALELLGTRPWTPADGGDFTAFGGVIVRGFSINNNRFIQNPCRSYRLRETVSGTITFFDVVGTDCNGNANITLVPSVRELRYRSNGELISDNDRRGDISVVSSGACTAGLPAYDPTKNPQPVTGPYRPTTQIPTAPPAPAPRLPRPITSPGIPSLPTGWPTGPAPAPAPPAAPGPEKKPGPDDSDKPGYRQPGPDDEPAPAPGPGTGPDDGGPCDMCAEFATIKEKLDELLEKEPLLVVPDSWPLKVESGRPQLVLIYSDKNPDKTFGSKRYQFCIPHFDSKLRGSLKAMLPKQIRKGSVQGTYTLNDNSKIITYCRTETEALRIINSFDKLVIKKMQTSNKKTGNINPGTRFLEVTIYPYEARYFPTGQHKQSPAWKDKLY